MVIGDKLKTLREQKNLSQDEIEKHTGCLRYRISRVENGRGAPSIETMEKLARALEFPMFRVYMYQDNVEKPNIPAQAIQNRRVNSKTDRDFQVLSKCLSHMDDKDRALLIHTSSRIAKSASTVLSTRQISR